jgi:hypothetical protein
MNLWLALALAQVPGVDAPLPTLLADRYRPVPWTTDGAGVAGGRAPTGGVGIVEIVALRRAVRWVPEGGEPLALLERAVGSHLGAAWGDGRWGVGVGMPIWWLAQGASWEGSQARLGDAAIDGLVQLGPRDARGAVCALGRATSGVGPSDRLLSRGGPAGELGLGASADPGPIRLAADALLRWSPDVPDEGLGLNDELVLRGRVSAGDRHAAWVELFIDRPWARPDATSAELLAGGRVAVTERTALVGGLGLPLSGAVGLPAGRLTLGLRASTP